MSINISEILQQAVKRLVDSNSARLDSELLLCEVFACERSYLHAHPEEEVPTDKAETFAHLVQRRAAGEPIAYIIGKQDFWDLTLKVSPDVLIPRPETELLVEEALALLPEDKALRMVDLGTGSGAIALALAKARPQWQVDAVDNSVAALAVAHENAKKYDLKNIHFYHGEWFAPLADTQYDLIVSNPPYIAETDPALEEMVARYEPRQALIAEQDGLACLHRIAADAKQHLVSNGLLMLEHGFLQQPALVHMLEQMGYHSVTGLNDYSDLPRAVVASL